MAEITFREALKRALREELARDPEVVVWGKDIVAYGGGGAYAVTAGLAKEFPGRLRDGAGTRTRPAPRFLVVGLPPDPDALQG